MTKAALLFAAGVYLTFYAYILFGVYVQGVYMETSGRAGSVGMSATLALYPLGLLLLLYSVVGGMHEEPRAPRYPSLLGVLAAVPWIAAVTFAGLRLVPGMLLLLAAAVVSAAVIWRWRVPAADGE